MVAMSLVLYNTLSQRKEPFEPAEPGHAKVYVCGPTVQSLAHLGHARCYTGYDVLVRHLRESGLKVTYVRNITDVNDSIVKKAQELGEDPLALARRVEAEWMIDISRLGNVAATIQPRVTEHMPEILELIERLISKGAAYESQGDVYFRVKSFADYGKLSHRKLEDLEMGASGRTNDEESQRKEHPADFALWKKSPEGEQCWDSPWGKGRPGWHIECSAMSMKHLGETFDLHAGGLDLVFPHHENEIAQSEAATGKTYARHWMHNGFVEVSKEKMSKSKGNFFTVRDLFERYEPEAIRVFALSIHYRSPLNLDWTLDDEGNPIAFPQIEEAERRVEYLYSTRERLLGVPEDKLVSNLAAPAAIAEFSAKFSQSLDDDLNTPVAIAAMYELMKEANDLAETATRRKKAVSKDGHAWALAGLNKIGRVLGIGNADPQALRERIRTRRAAQKGVKPEHIEAKIEERNTARAAKDFARADAARAELTALGVELMDSPEGTTWHLP